MTPLKTLAQIVEYLKIKPLEFWEDDIQEKIKTDSRETIAKLKGVLEQKELQETRAFKVLLFLEKDSGEDFDEVALVQHLNNLIEVYRLGEIDEDMAEFLDATEDEAQKAKKKLLEYHVAIENLDKRGKKMSEEEKVKVDLEHLQKVGIFYVLEYTIQVIVDMKILSDGDKQKLVESGLKTPAGNLPAYLPLEETFKKELCYKVFDKNIRERLLQAFYKFDEVFYNYKDIGWDAWVVALRAFNISLLQAFQAKGMVNYKTAIYAPYGDNISISELIQAIG